MSSPAPLAPREFPKVPAHAWGWLQRSRPVLTEAAQRLTGGPPTAAFLDDLKESFREDAFVRDVLIGVIADVAFNGRIPTRRPAGATWDRGLIWWGAAIAGVPPSQFDSPVEVDATQRQLFDVEGGTATPPAAEPEVRPIDPRRVPSPERARLANTLRQLLASADGDRVPASAVRQLIAQLEGE